MKAQTRHPRSYSFEFFPPRSDKARARLEAACTELAALRPRFFSVTFGAGGSTRSGTYQTVVNRQRETGVDVAPHLSCVGSDRAFLRDMLHAYREQGMRNIVALRGDEVPGMDNTGAFSYANELVAFIREETGDHFHIEVAAYPEMHPQAVSPAADLENFRRKVEAGADSAMTQYFFNADAYYDFVDRCEAKGVSLPIVPGIMPITNYAQLARFSDTCGADIPRWIRKRLEAFGEDKASIEAFGEEVITGLCQRLLEAGAPGLHFYTLNRAGPTKAIWRNLGLPEPKARAVGAN
jgi:methylenetetrahydrofolate reductase (NADPH)